MHHKIHWRFWYGSAPDTDPHPDPVVRGTDPRIWIRTKMSRIRNTDLRSLDQDCLCDIYCREEADWITGDPEPDGLGQEGAFHPRLGISHHCSRSAYSFYFRLFAFRPLSTLSIFSSGGWASILNSIVADPGCFPGSWLPDPGSDLFQPRIQGWHDPGSGSASKNLNIFNPKNWYQFRKNSTRDVHPGSGSWIWIFFSSRIRIPEISDPEIKSTGSQIRIRNTGILDI